MSKAVADLVLVRSGPMAATHTLRGIQTVTFSYSVVAGPRSLDAGVTIHYEPGPELVIDSIAQWPPNDDYTDIVCEEIRLTVALLTKERLGGHFRLERVEFHPVNSCAVAFRQAAREAVRSIFSMSELIQLSDTNKTKRT